MIASNPPFQKFDKKLFIFPSRIHGKSFIRRHNQCCGSGMYSGSRIQGSKRKEIPDLDSGVKKAPDPGSAAQGTTTEKDSDLAFINENKMATDLSFFIFCIFSGRSFFVARPVQQKSSSETFLSDSMKLTNYNSSLESLLRLLRLKIFRISKCF